MNAQQKTRLVVATKDLQRALYITGLDEDVLAKLAALRYEVDMAYRQLSARKSQKRYAFAC